MFEKNVKLALLLDYYAEALDERTERILRAYYEDDLSLSELAQGEGISRQGIRHTLKKGEETLLFLEERLGLFRRSREIAGATGRLRAVSDRLLASEDPALRALGTEVDAAVQAIQGKTV